jgi:molecular chaperone GrpE
MSETQDPNVSSQNEQPAHSQDSVGSEGEPTESPAPIVEVLEVEHTAESVGVVLPESRDESERLLIRELGDARLEADELLGNLQRVTAEFDNYRKRTERDRVETVLRAGQRVIESLLPTLDSLEAAIAIEPTSETEVKMIDGMVSTHSQLLEALKHDGFAPIEAVGSPFDPALHEAISVIPGEGDQIVDQEVRKGYVMGGRVIRPSLVVVGHA